MTRLKTPCIAAIQMPAPASIATVTQVGRIEAQTGSRREDLTAPRINCEPASAAAFAVAAKIRGGQSLLEHTRITERRSGCRSNMNGWSCATIAPRIRHRATRMTAVTRAKNETRLPSEAAFRPSSGATMSARALLSLRGSQIQGRKRGSPRDPPARHGCVRRPTSSA